MTFIGRTQELRFLESCYTSAKAQLVFLYGRRRVGKTETLMEFAKGKNHVFFAAQAATKDEQLATFSRQLFEAGSPAGRYTSSYGDWNSALSDIVNLPQPGRKLIILDEFPYLVKGDPSLPSVLQNLWDHTLSKADVMIVLCGSAMSFIEKELLSQKSPLYGRATGILKMEPMPYWDAVKFLPNYSAIDKAGAFAVLGGVPHYLAQFDPGLDLEDNIKRHILRKGSALYSEAEFLMHQEFRETATYNSIIQAVALGATKANEIAQKTLIPTASLSAYLTNLVEIGILEREFTVDAKLAERSKKQRGLYHIVDNFFRFWYAYVFSNRSDLEMSDVDGVYRYAVAPTFNAFAATPFERMCATWMRRENITGRLPFRAARIGRWWNATTEIDVVAQDTDRSNAILGECKFTTAPIDGQILDALQAKSGQCKADNHWYYLFARSGFTSGVRDAAASDDHIRLIDLDEIMRSDNA